MKAVYVSEPLVSVITPTWQRHERLLGRCMPAVQDQDWARTEHVIVSDGPDPVLEDKIDQWYPDWDCEHPLQFDWLAAHDERRHWGSAARRYGATLARGEFITYCDDDDELRAGHVSLLAKELIAHPGAGFAYSHMLSHQPSGEHLIGDCDPPVYGQIGSPMIMHRRWVLEHATWGESDAAEDWQLVQLWLAAAIPYRHVPQTTVDVYPSAYAHLE